MSRGAWLALAIGSMACGSWPTVEKDAKCAERPNRHAFGSATSSLAITVESWADGCP